MQKPVATQQNVLPLCKKARKSHWAHTCDRGLRENFPGHTGLAFQFIPSDLWKTMAEPVLNFKVNRRNLNAKNVALVVALVLLPSEYHAFAAVALVELCFYQRGALLPKEVSACLTSWEKEAIGLYLSNPSPLPGSLEEDILRLYGLDSSMLQKDPVYQKLLKELHACRLANMMPATTCPSIWLRGLGSTGTIDHEKKLREAIMQFLDGKRNVLVALCRQVGLERVRQTKALLCKDLDQHLGHLEHYSANFQGHLTEPCPACGKPCPLGPYPCPCQRPLLEPPIWPGQGKKNPSPSVVGPGINHVGRRRGKNVQTSMSFGFAPKPAQSATEAEAPIAGKKNHASTMVPPSRTSEAHTGKQKNNCREPECAVATEPHATEIPIIEPSKVAKKSARRARRKQHQQATRIAKQMAAANLLLENVGVS